MFQSDCTTAISDVSVSITNLGTTPKDESHDTLVLACDVDKANIAGSSIWNPATNKLELCVVVNLLMEDPRRVVVEDKRVLTIDFDLIADFNFTNDLGAGSIKQGAGSTNVDDYVMACKCGGPESFTCDSSPLPPNDRLHVCVRSVEEEVEVATIDSMVSTCCEHDAHIICSAVGQLTSKRFSPDRTDCDSRK